MKYIGKFLLSIMFVLSSATFVQAEGTSSDLPARLKAEVDSFKHDISTLRGQQLIGSADLLTGTGLSDPELYAVLETKTKEIIVEHEAKPKDKVIPEELNSLIRALASMNPASRDIIVNLVETSSSRGVRNRAHRLPPKLAWFAQRNAIMQKPDFYQPGQDLMTHRYLNLLADADYSYGRWALEEMDRRRGAEPVVYKKMAEILAHDKDNIKSDVHLDYLAWIAKLLVRYDRANSEEVRNSILNDPRKDKQLSKLKKYAK